MKKIIKVPIITVTSLIFIIIALVITFKVSRKIFLENVKKFAIEMHKATKLASNLCDAYYPLHAPEQWNDVKNYHFRILAWGEYKFETFETYSFENGVNISHYTLEQRGALDTLDAYMSNATVLLKKVNKSRISKIIGQEVRQTVQDAWYNAVVASLLIHEPPKTYEAYKKLWYDLSARLDKDMKLLDVMKNYDYKKDK